MRYGKMEQEETQEYIKKKINEVKQTLNKETNKGESQSISNNPELNNVSNNLFLFPASGNTHSMYAQTLLL